MTIASALSAAAIAKPASRVLSMNVCADQLLLELADPQQIVALSELSRDPDSSYHHIRAAAYLQAHPTAEEVLTLEPSLVIASSYGQEHTIALLQQQHLHVERMPIAQTLDDLFANIYRMGDWLGKQTKSAKMVQKLKDRLNTLPEPQEPRPLAAVFDANGYTAGALSLRGQMLELAGFDNLARHIGVESYGKISLESLLTLAPEVIIDSPYRPDTYSRAQALPRHPALRRSKLAPEVIPLVVNSTICSGPWTIDNIETLAQHRLSMQKSTP